MKKLAIGLLLVLAGLGTVSVAILPVTTHTTHATSHREPGPGPTASSGGYATDDSVGASGTASDDQPSGIQAPLSQNALMPSQLKVVVLNRADNGDTIPLWGITKSSRKSPLPFSFSPDGNIVFTLLKNNYQSLY